MKYPKLLVCMTALAFAIALPATAFAEEVSADSGMARNGSQAAGGWFDGERPSMKDSDGKLFEIHAGIMGSSVAYQVETTDKAPSNWPANADNALDLFFTISRGDEFANGPVTVAIEFDQPYDGRALVWYIQMNDGSTEIVEGSVGDSQYLISSINEENSAKAEGCLIGVAFASENGGSDAGEAIEFTDVHDDTYHVQDIIWLANSGITTGFEDKTFRPMSNVARCDMAAFLYRLAGEPEYTIQESDWKLFKDVDENTPHAKAIFWMAANKVTTGFPDGGFHPYASIARCDMAAFIDRFCHLEDIVAVPAGVEFKDVNAETSHAASIDWLSGAGITTGFPDGGFHPYDSIVRCDMAAFLHRVDDFLMSV